MFLNFQGEASKQAIPLPPPDETTALNTGEKKTYTEGMYRAHLKFEFLVKALNLITNYSKLDLMSQVTIFNFWVYNPCLFAYQQDILELCVAIMCCNDELSWLFTNRLPKYYWINES